MNFELVLVQHPGEAVDAGLFDWIVKSHHSLCSVLGLAFGFTFYFAKLGSRKLDPLRHTVGFQVDTDELNLNRNSRIEIYGQQCHLAVIVSAEAKRHALGIEFGRA